MKYDHIDNICEQFDVSIPKMYHYNRENKEEIKHIVDIFNLIGNNKEKVLATLYLLTYGEEDDDIKKYREKTGLNETEYNSTSLIEQYKVMLLTAFIYNNSFYARAMDYKGFIRAGFIIGEIKRDVFVTPRNWGDIVGKEENNGHSNIVNFPRLKPNSTNTPIEIAAAIVGNKKNSSESSFD